MRHLGPWQCLAGCTLLFAAASHATVYEINSTSDVEIEVAVIDDDSMAPWDENTVIELTPAVEDGFCSIREAVYASNYRMAVDGCEAGTGNDSIKLQRDTVYTLTEGELPIGFGEKVKVVSEEVPDLDTPDPNDTKTEYTVTLEPLANQIRFNVELDAFEETDELVLPVITADHQSRLINIDQGGAISLDNIELRDGDANAAGDGNGGLITAAGTVIVGQDVTMSGGQATNGGAVYMTEGSGIAFRIGGRFENNIASNVGSVIATSNLFNGNIIGYGFYMAGNEAQGGADAGVIHMDGDSGSRIGLELGNGTITNNLGGVINVVSDNFASVLVNMTIAFNDGTALTMAETAFANPGDAETTDLILHTVMVGNTNACGGVLDSSYVYTNADAAPRLLFTITDDADCPVPEDQGLTPVTSNPNGAESDIFLGDSGACGRLDSGAGACTPMSAEDIEGPYPGFRPNPLPAAVDPDSPNYVADDAASLFDRGNPENVALDQCEATDNRGKSRGGPGGRCDVGAIEFLRAQAQPDEIDLISGRSVLGDVVANDLNDTSIDCRNLDDVIVDEGTCAANDAPCLEQARLDRCLTVVEPPERGSAVPVIDANGYPRIRYTPASSFHGVDQIRYQVDNDAFFGGADLGLSQSEITNFVAKPSSGLVENKSIADSGGAQSMLMMLMMFVAGMIRRYRACFRGLITVVALVTGSQALAVDIEVDSLTDDVPPIKNDGLCTLREALENAAKAGSPDCAYGGSSTDTILLPAGVIELQATLVIEAGGVELVGKGARDDANDDEDTLTRIIRPYDPGTPQFRLFEVQPPNLSSGHPSVRFQFLTLENGYAAGVGDAGSGAVIVTGGSVIFDRVRIENNHAEADGGVAFVRSNAGNEKILTFNSSFVSSNSAGGSGGVISSTAQNGESFKVALVGSTFAANDAVDEGGVLDANIAAGEVQISNSTFLDNSAAKGSALDLSGITVNANIMNSSFMNNTGSSGIDLGDATTETRMSNSAYFDSGSTCTTGTTILHDSQYNAFSAAACAATSESNNQTAVGSASLAAALNNTETGTRGDYLPPYLIIENASTDMILVDTGNDQDSPVSGTGSPAACRAEDLRGIARTSGGRCDIGAFEYQQITAEDDEGSNQNTPARKVPVDIFENDLPSDGAEIEVVADTPPYDFLQGRFEFEEAKLINSDPEEYGGTNNFFIADPQELTRYELTTAEDTTLEDSAIEFVWLYYSEDRDGYDLKCGEPIPQNIINQNPDLFEDGDVADECVILFIPPSTPGFESRVCSSSEEDPVKVVIRYTFEDSNNAAVTEPAIVEMTIRDKPPVLKGRSVVNQPGQKVVFTLELEDPDNPDADIDWTRYNVTIAQEPSFTKIGEYGEVDGVGLIIEDRYDEDTIPHSDPADADKPARVTYIPKSNYNTFKDTFTLKVEDMQCGGSSEQARFSVRYINEETSAAAGSFGWALLGGALLLLRRRFAAA